MSNGCIRARPDHPLEEALADIAEQARAEDESLAAAVEEADLVPADEEADGSPNDDLRMPLDADKDG